MPRWRPAAGIRARTRTSGTTSRSAGGGAAAARGRPRDRGRCRSRRRRCRLARGRARLVDMLISGGGGCVSGFSRSGSSRFFSAVSVSRLRRTKSMTFGRWLVLELAVDADQRLHDPEQTEGHDRRPAGTRLGSEASTVSSRPRRPARRCATPASRAASITCTSRPFFDSCRPGSPPRPAGSRRAGARCSRAARADRPGACRSRSGRVS